MQFTKDTSTSMENDYYFVSNEQLKKKEVKHRRALNGHLSTMGVSMGLGVSSVLCSGGLTTPIVIAGLGYKYYKMHSHQKKLDAIYDELATRHVLPEEERKRDVLIPLATGLTGIAITQGFGHGLGQVISFRN